MGKEQLPFIDPRARGSALAELAADIDPKTGKPYTHARIAALVDIPPKVVGKVLREVGVYHFPRPEVIDTPLPENEMAFFQSLSFVNFSTRSITWGNHYPFIVIGTESKDQRHRRLLEKTVGNRGEIHSSDKKTVAYLHSPTFDFLLDKTPRAGFLDARNRYAPFLFALLGFKLTDKENLLSLKDPELLQDIYDRFLYYFGFSMGTLARKAGKPVSIIVKEPGMVLSALVQEKSVYSMSFFPSLVDSPRYQEPIPVFP